MLGMDPTAAYACVAECLKAELRLFGSSSPGAQVLQRPGVLASIAPVAKQRSLFNGVYYQRPEDLLEAYDFFARTYRSRGVQAWTVWVHPGDSATAQALAERGHKLDSQPLAMAALLADLELAEPGDLRWSKTGDFAVVAALNDAAYGFPPPAFIAALAQAREPRWHAYVAHLDQRAVASVLVHHGSDANAGVTGVATLPEARGTGIASRLLSVALRDAQAQGMLSTSLQASPKGRSVYARMGYQDVGTMQMWELRETSVS
jgi:GNAT superfamily N-acetyltransferase